MTVKMETVGDLRNHLGTIPANELEWKGNPCPKCGKPLDVFRNMGTHQISRYICDTPECGYMSGDIVAVCPKCGKTPQHWTFDPNIKGVVACGDCGESIPYKQYMDLDLKEIKEET